MVLFTSQILKTPLGKIKHKLPLPLRVMEFGQDINVGDPKVDRKGQGHRSKVKVPRSKNVILGVI